MTPTSIFIQLIIGGLLLGGIYALIAFGLSIIYGVSRVLNLAHGTILMVAGILASWLFMKLGINPIFIALLLVPVFLAAGAGFWRSLIKPLTGKKPLEFIIGSVLVTVGAMMVIDDVTIFIAGPTLHSIPFTAPSIKIGEVVISTIRLWLMVILILITIGLHLYFTKTFTGKAIRAITQDTTGAMLVGVDITQMNMVTFGIGFILVAIASVFYDMMFTLGAYMGFPLTVKAFTIVILGGLGSLVGPVIGGIILGVAETITSFYFGSDWSPALSVIILLIILVLRPQGIFGYKQT
jgi:branched-chain amino acid transport system permease protein